MKTRILLLISLITLLLFGACSGIVTAPIPSITLEPTDTDDHSNSLICKGPYMGIQLTLPTSDWKCDVETQDETNETISIISPVFNIQITTFGRGPFCNFPNQDTSCTSTPFYENKILSLSTWSSYDKAKEIYGVINRKINGKNAAISVSIKYQGMENQPLSQADKDELIKFLDSIQFAS